MQLQLLINPDGTLSFIYHDQLAPLFELGQTEITRASHVEPEGTSWLADLSPVNGPQLGPFTTRQMALDAEVAWLNQNILGGQIEA